MGDPTPNAAIARLMNTEVAAGVLDLSIGEPDQPLPPVLLDRAISSLRAGTGYTPKLGLQSLRERIATHLPADVDPADVVVTVGGTEAVAVAMEAVCPAGSVIVVPDPAWPNYRVLAEQLGIEVRTYRQGTRNGEFFDFEAIESALQQGARLIVVNSPSNPMALVAGEHELQRLAEILAPYDAFVLSDEAYEAIVFDGLPAPSPLSISAIADRVLVARTFSKIYSMTGLRAGALIAPTQLRARVAAIHGTTVGCAPRVAQEVAEYALEAMPGRAAELSEIYRRRFALALERVGEWMPQQQVEGNGGFYVWLAGSHTGRSAAELAEALEKRGFRVSSGNAYTAGESHAVRLALTAPEAELERAFVAVREVFTV